VKSQKDILSNNRGDFERRSFTFVDYAKVDQTLAPDGKSVGALCCIDYTSNWENLTPDDYRSKKKEVAQIFIRKLEEVIPGISDKIVYHEVATPLTVKRYTLNPEGAVYGFEQIPFNVPVDTAGIAGNLHFASAWTRTGGGFSGAIYSGYFCALNILRRKASAKE
jgi:phytoene dehydrogenase-like protein